ncbi:MAG: cohesin domain-containing protein, partial [candidate division KSB1 bacterium]|nr:cohesin domain-containing protein [candidate division KSB1 bacterium]
MRPKFILWLGGLAVILLFNSLVLSQVPFQVTHEAGGVGRFAWSPDGKQFAYVAFVADAAKLYRIDLDGTNRLLLAENLQLNPGNVDWKGGVITFKGLGTSGVSPYNQVLKRINPDGTNETKIIGPYWYGEAVLRADGNWLLFRDAPGGWWEAKRCDLNGANLLTVSHSSLVQGVNWLGKSRILYTRGANYYTPCKLYRVNFNGSGVLELTPNDLPREVDFSAAPDSSKILYCDGTDTNWDIWIMNADGSNKKQLTNHPKMEYLNYPLQNVWSLDSKSFFFVSNRSGKGDIYKMNADGTGLTQITFSDSTDLAPSVSPVGNRLAFLSNRDGNYNIWVIDFEKIHVFAPDTTEDGDKIVDIPLRVTDVTGKAIYSFGMTVVTDPTILTPLGAVTTGTITQPWGAATVNIIGGTMKIAIAGSAPLAGAGKLIYLRYQVPASVAHNAKTAIKITDFIFNDGQPDVVTHDGSFTAIRKYDISGLVKYYSKGTPIPAVTVKLDGMTKTTGNDGAFQFLDVIYGNYTLRPIKTGGSAQAVGPYDAALVLMYVVGSLSLTPYQMIAGDVTGNGTVTASDASKILRYYVGLDKELPIGKDWKFVPVSFPINNSNWSTAPDSLRYEPLNADKPNQDFVGIVYGDVSGNWQAVAGQLLLAQADQRIKLRVGSLVQVGDDRLVLPLKLEAADDMFSLGLTCNYDPRRLRFLAAELSPVATGQPLFAYQEQHGSIKLGLAMAQPIRPSGTIINLYFQPATAATAMGSGDLAIREFSLNGQLYQADLSMEGGQLAGELPAAFDLAQNYPNPFNAETLFKYQLPQDVYVSIQIYNLLGRKIRTLVAKDQTAGFHQIIWDGRDDA